MSKITNLTRGAVTIGVAATKQSGGWEHFFLGNTEDTSRLTDDPDSFVCYDAKGQLVKVIYEGLVRSVWRLHDLTTVEVRENESGYLEAFTTFGSFKLCGYYGGFPKCHFLQIVELEPFHYDFPKSI